MLLAPLKRCIVMSVVVLWDVIASHFLMKNVVKVVSVVKELTVLKMELCVFQLVSALLKKEIVVLVFMIFVLLVLVVWLHPSAQEPNMPAFKS